jgi:hypothetical protein
VHHADDGHPGLLQQSKRPPRVHLSQVLRRRDEESAGERQFSRHDLDLGARAGRGVNDEDIDVPADLEEEVA